MEIISRFGLKVKGEIEELEAIQKEFGYGEFDSYGVIQINEEYCFSEPKDILELALRINNVSGNAYFTLRGVMDDGGEFVLFDISKRKSKVTYKFTDWISKDSEDFDKGLKKIYTNKHVTDNGKVITVSIMDYLYQCEMVGSIDGEEAFFLLLIRDDEYIWAAFSKSQIEYNYKMEFEELSKEEEKAYNCKQFFGYMYENGFPKRVTNHNDEFLIMKEALNIDLKKNEMSFGYDWFAKDVFTEVKWVDEGVI